MRKTSFDRNNFYKTKKNPRYLVRVSGREIRISSHDTQTTAKRELTQVQSNRETVYNKNTPTKILVRGDSTKDSFNLCCLRI